MVKNLLIIASVTLNLSFLYYFYEKLNSASSAAPPNTISQNQKLIKMAQPDTMRPITTDSAAQPTMASPEHTALSDYPGEFEKGNYASLAAMLRSQAYPEDLVRQIVLAAITRDQLSNVRTTGPSPYWLQDEANQTAHERQLRDEEARRQVLLDTFGSQIVDDPLFAALFKPLNDTLPFLDSGKQIAIYELKQRSNAARGRVQSGFITEMREDRFKEAEDFEAALQSILSADEYLEYQLRESTLSDRMKQTMTSFDYSEQEFRDIFSIRSNHEGSEFNRLRDRESYREQRRVSQEEIKNYLGDDRYKEFSRSQDPAFRSLLSIGERYGNTTREMTEVYEVSVATQTEIGQIRDNESLSQAQRRDQIADARGRSMEEITNIVGEETAASIQSNSNRFRRFRGRP